MACLLHTPFLKDLLAPVETGAQAWAHLVHHFSAPSALPRQPPLSLVLISPDRFETQYAGSRPLPRDALLEDLKQLHKDGRFIALDLDVSPSPVSQTHISASSEEEEVRKNLNKYKERKQQELDQYIQVNKDRFLLILPFPVHDATTRKAKAEWLVGMCAAKVQIADPRIERKFGVVTREMGHAGLSFAHFIRHALEIPEREGRPPKPDTSGALCDYITPSSPQVPPTEQFKRAMSLLEPYGADRQLDKLAVERCISAVRPGDCAEQRHGPMLSFGKSHLHFARFSWCAKSDPFTHTSCDPQPTPTAQLPAKLVLLGGDYDLADRFMTPLGEKTGADLHAFGVSQASITESHLGDLLADFGLGLIFGLVAHSFWGLWFDARRGRTTYRVFSERLFDLTPQTSWVALGLLTLSLSLLTVYALLLAAWLLVNNDLWLSPIPMVTGMTLDALVLGSAGVAAHKLGHSPPSTRALGLGLGLGLGKRLIFSVPTLLWYGVIGFVVFDIVSH